ncbi:hypothetical protein SAMN05421804_101590 [Proteiniclasticum ruminis]|uniref:Uncharacterized protein n=2 Tax=Proteiniclasticum ruminis TaxID=398199 RepID=A0A1G8HIA3_9CLOT|nr:hypothetical protein SAMN05421804_101590 [Proteiniclasticum ruminis]
MIEQDALDFSQFFQCDPILLDENVPFFYNEAVYDFINEADERFSVRLQPSNQDLKIEVFTGEERMAYLDFTGDFSLEILSSQRDFSKLRIKNTTGSAIVHFRPKFKLYIDMYFPDK